MSAEVTDAAWSRLHTVLIPLLQVPASVALHHHALDVRARWQFSFCDSLTVHNPFRA